MAEILIEGETWHVKLTCQSLIKGSVLGLEIDHPPEDVVIQVAAVRQDEDAWMMSAPLETDSTDATLAACPSIADLPVGLYLFTALQVGATQPKVGEKGPQVHALPSPQLFEIRPNCGMAPRTSLELEAAYQAVLRLRQELASAGIGSGDVVAQVFLFVKDLLMRTRLNLRICQVIPLDPVGWGAEIQHVNRFLSMQQQPQIIWSAEVARQVQLAEPATLIYFPVVRADSIDECAAIAIREALLLNLLLAVHRGSLGEIFCTVVQQTEPVIAPVRYSLHIPPYRGNLMGGFISGEEPESIRHNLSALELSPALQLYLTLLGEALRERHPDFMYVRFWSLLETIGKGQRLLGEPILSWNGQPVSGGSGHPLLIGSARALVFELLRRILAPGISDRSLAAGLTYGGLSEQIAIWYRRRNCTAHGDQSCVCREPSRGAIAGAGYTRCYTARGDDQAGIDRYLQNLQEVTKLVVFKLLREGYPTDNSAYQP